jgi:circadian clock protein KaiC
MYFALEESEAQIIRNMLSIGIDLEQWEKKGLLKFFTKRPTFYGLESYLTAMHKEVNTFKPQVVVIDPISSFIIGNNEFEAKSMIMRLIDFLKLNNITSFMTSLTSSGTDLEHTEINISSLIDTWLLLRDIETCGERNRGLYILKSRGMAHSNQIREFILTGHGVELLDVYVGPEGVFTGSARIAQQAKENEEQLLRKLEVERTRLELERKHRALESQIALLQVEYEAEKAEALKVIGLNEDKNIRSSQDRIELSKSRKADTDVKKTVINKTI